MFSMFFISASALSRITVIRGMTKIRRTSSHLRPLASPSILVGLILSMISPLSEGLELLDPHHRERLQIIPVVVRGIVHGLELVEHLDDEALLSHLFPVLCQGRAGKKGPHPELKPNAVDGPRGVRACRKVNAAVCDVLDLHDPHRLDGCLVFLDQFFSVHDFPFCCNLYNLNNKSFRTFSPQMTAENAEKD